jgi:hypothetical protein
MENKYKVLLVELLCRSRLVAPVTEEHTDWFVAGFEIMKGGEEFLERLNDAWEELTDEDND